jgi:hypothetical protein
MNILLAAGNEPALHAAAARPYRRGDRVIVATRARRLLRRRCSNFLEKALASRVADRERI